MLNPFHRSHADSYSTEEVVGYYCPTPAFALATRAENQVIFGGPGTGKSILLKRLAYRASRNACDSLTQHPFIGVYVNCIRELAFLNALCDSAKTDGVRSRIPDVDERLNAIIRHYACLTLASSLCKELAEGEAPSSAAHTWLSDLARSIGGLCGVSCESIKSCRGALRDRRIDILARVANQSAFTVKADGECELRGLTAFVGALSEIATDAFSSRTGEDWEFYLLLDQYDSLNDVLQKALNDLLSRGNCFFAKAAVRPYALNTLERAEGPDLVPNEDFVPVYIEYPVGQEKEYADLLESLTSRMMGSDTGIRPVLDMTRRDGATTNRPSYADFPTLSHLSCGLIRNFLDLCAVAVDSAAKQGYEWRKTGFLDSDLSSAAVILSRRELERVSSVKGLLGQPVRQLVEGLCRRLKSPAMAGSRGEIVIRTDLFKALPNEISHALRKAFENGAIRYAAESDASLFTVPSRFIVNPIFFPRFGIAVEV